MISRSQSESVGGPSIAVSRSDQCWESFPWSQSEDQRLTQALLAGTIPAPEYSWAVIEREWDSPATNGMAKI